MHTLYILALLWLVYSSSLHPLIITKINSINKRTVSTFLGFFFFGWFFVLELMHLFQSNSGKVRHEK